MLLEDVNDIARWRARPPFLFVEGRIVAQAQVPPVEEWTVDDQVDQYNDGGLGTIELFVSRTRGF